MNNIAKLYDMILYNRLACWFVPFTEQAGSQSKRGCLEHIVTLHLLIDYTKKRKLKLFVTFVDFSKAHDKVQWKNVFMIMRRLGCKMAALVAIYHGTQGVIGSAVMTATLGYDRAPPLHAFCLFCG